MIDIHTHLLPGVDDGSQSLEETLQLAHAAVAEGITGVIATPHHRNGHFDNEADSVRVGVALLRDAFRDNGIALEIRTGQEIRVYPELLDDLAAGKLLTLADSAYLLLEFPSGNVPHYALEIIYELLLLGKIPVIAHPERNMELANRPERLQKLIEQGAMGQITSHSVNGAFGRSIQKVSLSMLRNNLGHFLSSDVHHMKTRDFSLQQAYHRVEKEFGAETVRRLRQNARNLWENSGDAETEIVSERKKKPFLRFLS